MRVIGLTGGIASGKSTVSNIFKNAGIPIIDADVVARKVVEKDSVGLMSLTKRFGNSILLNDGSLDRTQLGRKMFSDASVLKEVNDLLQPLIRTEIELQIQEAKHQHNPLLILDIPLLFEMHYETLCDDIIVVAVSVETQIQRLKNRNGLTKEEALKRIESQMSLEKKVQKADIVCRILNEQAFFRNAYCRVRKHGYSRFRLHFEIIVKAGKIIFARLLDNRIVAVVNLY